MPCKCHKCKEKIEKGKEKYLNAKCWCGRCLHLFKQKKADLVWEGKVKKRRIRWMERLYKIQQEMKKDAKR